MKPQIVRDYQALDKKDRTVVNILYAEALRHGKLAFKQDTPVVVPTLLKPDEGYAFFSIKSGKNTYQTMTAKLDLTDFTYAADDVATPAVHLSPVGIPRKEQFKKEKLEAIVRTFGSFPEKHS